MSGVSVLIIVFEIYGLKLRSGDYYGYNQDEEFEVQD